MKRRWGKLIEAKLVLEPILQDHGELRVQALYQLAENFPQQEQVTDCQSTGVDYAADRLAWWGLVYRRLVPVTIYCYRLCSTCLLSAYSLHNICPPPRPPAFNQSAPAEAALSKCTQRADGLAAGDSAPTAHAAEYGSSASSTPEHIRAHHSTTEPTLLHPAVQLLVLLALPARPAPHLPPPRSCRLP